MLWPAPLIGEHWRLMTVQTQFVVEDFAFGRLVGVDLPQDVFRPLGRPNAVAGLIAANQILDFVKIIDSNRVLILRTGVTEKIDARSHAQRLADVPPHGLLN